jgi:hypothetical protein
VPLVFLDLGSTFVGSREGLKEINLLEQHQSRTFLAERLLVGFETTSSTYTAIITTFIISLCKAALRQSLGRNMGEFKEFASIVLSMAEADGHIFVVVRRSMGQSQQEAVILA